MEASADALAFTPPPEPAAVRGFVLAVIAHLLLVLALSISIDWDKDTAPAAIEAELWSSLPQEAAPPPPPPPVAQPEPQQQVVPPPPVAEPPPQPVEKQPDIALEREKQRKQEEAKRREEERKQLEAQKRKAEEQQRLAEEKKKREEQAKKEKLKKEQEAKLREQARKDQLARMQQALAEGNGSPSSRGLAQKASGPSDSYAGRIRARVKPNIVFADDAPGNPSAEVEVRMAPDGTIVSRKVTKSSGVPSWDQAVLRALDRTEVLPRDVDGRVHTPLIIAFKLRD